MKRGDIVRYRREIIEPWARGQHSQERIDYFSGELKIESVSSSGEDFTFSYPPGGLDGMTGNWTVNARDFELVRLGEPEKCKWKKCGKLHNEQGLCIR